MTHKPNNEDANSDRSIAQDSRLTHEAMDWIVRVNDPDFDDWLAWEDWMARDASHREAYWEMAVATTDGVSEIVALLSDPSAVRTEQTSTLPHPPRRLSPSGAKPGQLVRRRLVAALAASLVAAFGIAFWTTLRPDTRPAMIETSPGEIRLVSLPDGTQAQLAGATRLRITGRREVALEAGQATFTVVDNAAEPFAVAIGSDRIIDLGTVFDVTRLADGLRVTVQSGRVRYQGGAGLIVLDATDGLRVRNESPEQFSISTDQATGWHNGRLDYSEERLDVIAADVGRALGLPVAASPAATGRRFTGSFTVTEEREAFRLRLAALLEVEIVSDGKGWMIQTPDES